MKEAWLEVRKFHETFGHPVSNSPTRLDPEYKANRLKWLREELQEFEDANTLEDEVDAMIDELYFVFGTLVSMGVDPEPIFKIVQQANMAKVWEDGKVHYKEDGKIAKPANWVAPEPLIVAEINRQIAASKE